MKLGANDCVLFATVLDFLSNILQVSILLECCCFFPFLRFLHLWFGFFLWQTTVRFSLLVLHFSFIRLKIWIGFHFCCIFYSFYKHDIFLEFVFFHTHFIVYCTRDDLLLHFIVQLQDQPCVCVCLSVFE